MATGSKKRTGLSRRQWLGGALATGAAGCLGAGVYSWRIEPHWVRVVRRSMPLANLPAALVGRRLVQVSDLHIGPVVDNDYLRGALCRVAEIEPDYVVVTGDFMTTEQAEQVPLTLRTLADSPLVDTPTFAVLGNHDYGRTFRNREVASRLTDGLDSLGFRVLRNEATTVDGLQIAGSDDLWAGACNVYQSLLSVDHQLPTVYLAHNPDIADVRGWTTFGGWILSGHTHGGQCRLPLLGPPVLPVRNRRYAAGHVRLSGGRNLYVNRGLGYKQPLRFGVRPEITVFTLAQA